LFTDCQTTSYNMQADNRSVINFKLRPLYPAKESPVPHEKGWWASELV